MCDYYAFTSITIGNNENDFKDFYYLGHYNKQLYFNDATFKQKGDSDGGNYIKGKGEFKIREDCYNLKYNKLQQYTIDILKETIPKGFQIIPW